MLLNHDRANEIMDREGLDGLVAVNPLNQYYLSGYWGLFNTPDGYEAAYAAVLPRREEAPAALIMPALELRRLETDGGTWMPNIFSYSSPAEDALLDDGTARGADYAGWPTREGAALEPLEAHWNAIVRRLGHQMSPDAFWAMTRAIKAAGLTRARVCTDDARTASWLAHCGLNDIECVLRPELFNEIRMVKTPDELAIMRVAARVNERALLTAADAMHEGASWDELENVYMIDMAQQGGRGVYLMCGVGGLPAATVRRHEPVLFDALGRYGRYHGDFGRCVVVGEPSAEHRARHAAICVGWEVAQAYLKPGVTYATLARAVGDAVRGEGFAGFRDPVVHGLGLEHTDDPKHPGVQPQAKPDQTLQANMVVNVDMPHTEIGWGSVHMEDTVVITADGCERLSAADFSLRVVG